MLMSDWTRKSKMRNWLKLEKLRKPHARTTFFSNKNRMKRHRERPAGNSKKTSCNMYRCAMHIQLNVSFWKSLWSLS